jgi:hypothetical protein
MVERPKFGMKEMMETALSAPLGSKAARLIPRKTFPAPLPVASLLFVVKAALDPPLIAAPRIQVN